MTEQIFFFTFLFLLAFFFRIVFLSQSFFLFFFVLLVFLASILLTSVVSGLSTDLLVVLLECGKILASFRELTLLHTLTDVPVDEGTLGVHEIELVIDAGEDFSDGGGVGNHADGALHLCEVTSWNDGWWLVVDTALEASWAPVDKLDCALCLDGCDCSVDILWHDVTAEHEAASHVLAVAWVALCEHRCWLECCVCDLSNGELFVVCFLGRDDWCVACQDEVDAWVWDQVCLEFSDINVEGTVEAERCCQGRHDLADEAVEVGVCWALDVQVATAQIINCFVVKHGGNIGVLEECVCGENRVVWLNDSGRHLWRWVDGVTELGLLAVVNGETLEQEGAETRACATADSVEDEEALETSAVVSKLADAVQAQVNDFLSDCVMATGVVVCSILLAGDELLWVEELTVCAGADFINDGWLKIKHHAAWNVLASASLREKGVVCVIFNSDCLVGWHRAVWLNSVLEAKKLPTCVASLDTSLANVDGNDFAHCC